MSEKIIVQIAVHHADEAIKFYQKVLGAKLKTGLPYPNPMLTKDVPKGLPAMGKTVSTNPVIHCEMTFAGQTFFVSDIFEQPNAQHQTQQHCDGSNVTVCLDMASEAELKQVTEGLASAGGMITMPIADQFWGAKFAMVRDHFGVNWALNYDKPKK